MKKILWMLLIALCVGGVQAAPAGLSAGSHRQTAAVKKAASVQTAQDFLDAARKGNLAEIARLQNPSFLTAQDAYGYNAFHLAKNIATVHTIAATVRRLQPDNYIEIFKILRDQRSYIGETPLIYHVRLGKEDTFGALYRGSSLSQAVHEANAVNKDGALRTVAGVRQQVARQEASDNSGQTVADMAKANNLPGVIAFLETHAPYLFTK